MAKGKKKTPMRKCKIKKGDIVMVITGEDKGKTGKVIEVISKESRIRVEGVNIVKRAVRKSQQYPQGGFVEFPAPIHISNVKLVCPKCGKTTRPKYKIINEKKVRVCRKCEEIIDKV